MDNTISSTRLATAGATVDPAFSPMTGAPMARERSRSVAGPVYLLDPRWTDDHTGLAFDTNRTPLVPRPLCKRG